MSRADSIRACLRRLALQTEKPYEYLQTHYFIERFLYRLSVSAYGERFVLKGGLLLHVLFDERARATRDIDLLARRMENSPEELLGMMRAICTIQADDGVVFDPDSFTYGRITEETEYAGIRLKVIGYLERSRSLVQLDVGFSDAVIPRPQPMTYPSLLDGEGISLLAYSRESIIAEKFQAMCSLAMANSRMKDFYDIRMMALENDFRGEILQAAIRETFRRRKTDLQGSPLVFTAVFSEDKDKQMQWSAFLKRTRIPVGGFADTLALIRQFLQPVVASTLAGSVFHKQWSHETKEWIDPFR